MKRLILLVLTALFGTTIAKRSRDLIEDDVYNKMLEEMELEEQEARGLLEVEADGLLGSKCGIFQKCNAGFDCFHNRCIPNRDCLKDRLKEFDASFDHEGYKQTMFRKTGVTEESIQSAYRDSNGDDATFVQSDAMQSIIHYMQRNREPFEPVAEIVDSCAGLISARRLNNAGSLRALQQALNDTVVPEAPDLQDAANDTERVPDLNQQDAEYHHNRYDPSASPSLSNQPSASVAPSKYPSVYPTRSPTYSPSSYPTESPTIPRSSTLYTGVHVEGGLFLEISLTAAWRQEGDTPSDTYVRGCFGPVFGGGFEMSFYMATVFDGLPDGWACASMLFDSDVGIGLNLGMGLGTCFVNSRSTYLEYTIGAGFGGGFGMKLCGAQTLPTLGRGDTSYSRLEYGFSDSTYVREPSSREIRGLVVETERFYTDLFTKTYPNTFYRYKMSHVEDTFIQGNKRPVILDFTSNVEFRTSKKSVDEDNEEHQEAGVSLDLSWSKSHSYSLDDIQIFPTTKEIISVMKHADYYRYVSKYVHKAEPEDGLFSETKKVSFVGSAHPLRPADDSKSKDSDDYYDDDDYYHSSDDDYYHSSDDDDYYHPPSKDKDDDYYHSSDDYHASSDDYHDSDDDDYHKSSDDDYHDSDDDDYHKSSDDDYHDSDDDDDDPWWFPWRASRPASAP